MCLVIWTILYVLSQTLRQCVSDSHSAISAIMAAEITVTVRHCQSVSIIDCNDCLQSVFKDW
jgi:hypothetical protein